MFSSQVASHDYPHFRDVVFPKIKAALAAPKKVPGAAEHLEVLGRADPRAYYDYSMQTVTYSHEGNLLDRFLALPVPRYFLFGSENQHLSYLPRLRQSDCEVIEIPNADHFLFYSNPGAYAAALAGIAASLEGGLDSSAKK
jgi:pimeloyl-ACP methyl ester carboxylesterase